ncbi:MAG: hypothetical protein AAFO63_11415 [Pseudomonadota bacterium]
MPETSFDLQKNASPSRLNHVICQVVERYARTCPDALEMISVRTVSVNGELRRRVSSQSAALIDDIRRSMQGIGELSV